MFWFAVKTSERQNGQQALISTHFSHKNYDCSDMHVHFDEFISFSMIVREAHACIY